MPGHGRDAAAPRRPYHPVVHVAEKRRVDRGVVASCADASGNAQKAARVAARRVRAANRRNADVMDRPESDGSGYGGAAWQRRVYLKNESRCIGINA